MVVIDATILKYENKTGNEKIGEKYTVYKVCYTNKIIC